MSTTALADWITEHPEVIRIERIVKLTNPLKDVDDARRKMRALGGDTYRDVVQPVDRNDSMSTTTPSEPMLRQLRRETPSLRLWRAWGKQERSDFEARRTGSERSFRPTPRISRQASNGCSAY